MNSSVTTIFAFFLIGAGTYWLTRPNTPAETPSNSQASLAIVEVALPQSLSQNAKLGKTAYEAKCLACHAQNGEGQKGVAPPLIHKIYEPSHHGDESFQRAVAIGVRSHHWKFGDMPPVQGVTRADVKMIVAYVRELQRENGIH